MFTVSFEPGGDRLVAASFDGFSALASPPWPVDLDTVERFADVEVPGGSLSLSSWSPDGSKLFGTIRSRSSVADY